VWGRLRLSRSGAALRQIARLVYEAAFR
jgi:hypothetical protein